MADLTKPKESTPPKQENIPQETEEEKKIRLRKEKRRKLHVNWKSDHELTEVRLFTHDPEEEIGHDPSMMRDVGDVGGEGRVLKLHREFDELDEDEQEEELMPYKSLVIVDFSDVEGLENNFIKQAGARIPESPEKHAQDERETKSLGAFYTSPTDIPPSPKEPPPPSDENPAQTVDIGDPGGAVKTRSDHYFLSKAARSVTQNSTPPITTPLLSQIPTTTPFPTPGLDVSGILKLLQLQNQPPQPQPSFIPQPPNGIPNMNQLAFGVPQTPSTPTQGLDMQKIMAVMNAQKQMQTGQNPMIPPVTSVPPVPPVNPVPAIAPAPNLISLLTQISGLNSQHQNQNQNQDQNQNQNPTKLFGGSLPPQEQAFEASNGHAPHGTKRGNPGGDHGKPSKQVRPSRRSRSRRH